MLMVKPHSVCICSLKRKFLGSYIILLNACYFYCLILSGFFISSISSSAAASFNCAKASSGVERAICNSPQLSNLDDKVAALYKSVRDQSPYPNQILNEQRAWIQWRESCMTLGCVQLAYQSRIAS